MDRCADQECSAEDEGNPIRIPIRLGKKAKPARLPCRLPRRSTDRKTGRTDATGREDIYIFLGFSPSMTWFWTFKISGVQTPENDGVTHCENTRESRLNIPSSTSLLPKSVTFRTLEACCYRNVFDVNAKISLLQTPVSPIMKLEGTQRVAKHVCVSLTPPSRDLDPG